MVRIQVEYNVGVTVRRISRAIVMRWCFRPEQSAGNGQERTCKINFHPRKGNRTNSYFHVFLSFIPYFLFYICHSVHDILS